MEGDHIVPFSAKQFAIKLNECLDETGAPGQQRERANILSKMLGIPRQLSWSLLTGMQMPDQDLLSQISEEFEVEPAYLIGEK